MYIRQEQEQDIDTIHEVIYAAFLNHPQHTPGTLPHEPKLVNILRASGGLSLSLVAEDNGSIVGHIAFSEVLIDGKHSGWYGLGPVAVHPSRQRQSIGSALINQGIGALRERGARGIALVGDPDYYERFGFTADPELALEEVPPQYFLALPLAFPKDKGNVSFHPAFIECMQE
ncbi:MAG TPA: N-acetyltransferase [Candidatus Hydrogenedentes bacterium]|nr:N-acetyltransferase [Candidatus Hydrogenedentota bacterium]